MSSILAHPFVLVGNQIATVDDASDQGLAQQVAIAMTTRQGERQLAPNFGTPDPAFGGYDIATVNAVLALYGPAVRVTSLEATPIDARTAQVQVEFSTLGRSAW